jgi:uncharacterized protein involved in exopolysaccharide biosynthesis
LTYTLESEERELTDSTAKDVITLSELVTLVWRRRWTTAAVTAFFAGVAVAYAMFATEWWRAETLLVASEQKGSGLSGSLGALGGLAGIAGISLDDDASAEPLATLESSEFIGSFIQDEDLLPILFAQRWDAGAKKWRATDQREWPDARDGVRFFKRNILSVSEDPTTRLVTVAVEWTDPEVAAEWANELITRLNARMRERALADAERNVAYLRRELASADVVTMQESVARLLERELQKMMLARGNAEYAFRVIDPASAPKWRSRPQRVQVVVLGTIMGGIFAIFLVVLLGRRAGPGPG